MVKKGNKRHFILMAVFLSLAIVTQAMLPLMAYADPAEAAAESVTGQSKILKLWYNSQAPNTTDNTPGNTAVTQQDNDWQNSSLPIGNGYMGASIFGRTDTERITIAETSLQNQAGLNTFMNLYLDFNHAPAQVSNYYRDLVLNDSTSHVEYTYDGVTYTREYLASYPDKVTAIRLTASEPGKLSFTVKPVVPFVRPIGYNSEEVRGKTATVTADADTKTVTLKGNMESYNINYEGQVKVLNTGGTVTKGTYYFNPPSSAGSSYNTETLVVSGADEVVLLIGVGTNYHMTPEVFTTTPNNQKLNANEYPHDKVQKIIDDASEKTYADIRRGHVEDYTGYFDRVSLDLGGINPDQYTTTQRLTRYRSGTFDPYLEELFFQYGRYLLISSSRKGTLPAHLQGIWNTYEKTPWSGGFWHNINQQMNYWPSFNTNLIDLFESYADFNMAFRKAAENAADTYLQNAGSKLKEPSGQGLNGWSIATGVWPYRLETPSLTGHSGPGTGGMTTSMFWEYYAFSKDPEILENVTYPALSGMSNFLSKTLVEENGVYLVEKSASPEQMWRDPSDGVTKYYRTKGCAFDQQMVYDNYRNTLEGAQILGINDELTSLLSEQIDKLEPVLIGLSGQVKEYREENFYGDIINDRQHRHISNLMGLYPGYVINSTTPAWFDGARVTLNGRGDDGTGWAIGHKLNLWARMADGNRSYKLFNNLLKNGTYDNLWGKHAPFQIDCNFGGTSGVAEMLLQSHEGYISLLPSRPDTWNTGSYRGLTARGNFEVDASWKNGQAQEFVITSKSGEDCTLKYFNIAGACVTDSNGRAVSFETDGTDFISFSTEDGEKYTINDIPAYTATKDPSNLTLATGGTERGVNIKWEPSPDAVSYNVYVAVENQPDYTLIGNVTETNFAHVPENGKQFTFRVTAVAANGRESAGITKLLTAPQTPDKAVGIFVEDTVLQVTVTDTVGNSAYKLYEKNGDAYDSKAISSYNIIYDESAAKNKEYFVAAYDAVVGESSMIPVEIVAELPGETNVFLKKNAAVSPAALAGYGIEKLVDGDLSSGSRFAMNDGAANNPYTVTIDLGSEYPLKQLRTYEFSNPTRAQSMTMEVYNNGVWTAVAESPLSLSGATAVNPGGYRKVFDLAEPYPIASQVRFVVRSASNSIASFYEFECSTAPPTPCNKAALLEVLQKSDLIDKQAGFGTNMAPAILAAYTSAKTEAVAALLSSSATQTRVNNAAAALTAAMAQMDSASRAALASLIIKAEAFAQTIDSTNPLHNQAAADAFTQALAKAKTITAESPLADVNMALYKLQSSMDNYTGSKNTELTISLPNGGIFSGKQTLTLYNSNPVITRFHYTTDGTEPDGDSPLAQDKKIALTNGLYTLKVAGFLESGEKVTDTVSARYMILEGENVAVGKAVTGTGTPFDSSYAPERAVDGNTGTRWGSSSATQLTVNLGGTVKVDAIVIREFVEANQNERLGNLSVEYYDGSTWRTAFSGRGDTEPANGLRQRVATQHHAYAVILDTPVEAQQIRLNTGNGGASIWEFEIFKKLTARDIANGITSVTEPAKDAASLIIPAVPAGYKIGIKSSSVESVIAKDGTVAPPVADTTVNLVFTVTSTTDPEDTADTVSIPVFVPARTLTAQDVADSITSVTAPAADATILKFPAMPAGFTIALKSSSNEDVIALNGTITPPKSSTAVDLVFTVTKRADGTAADTISIPVTVPAKSSTIYDDLQALIAEAEGLVEADYTADTWAELQSALIAAKDITREDDTGDIQAAYTALRNAIDALEEIDLYADLQALIAEAEELVEADYTAGTWAELQSALIAAKDITREDDTGNIQAAYTALRNAIGSLEGYVAVTSVKIDGAAIQQVRIRNTKQFTATVNPTNATDPSLTWESSNPKIFTVDEEGLVKGVGTGSAKLIVTCADKTSFIMVQITA